MPGARSRSYSARLGMVLGGFNEIEPPLVVPAERRGFEARQD
jgi:hypothetical protein